MKYRLLISTTLALSAAFACYMNGWSMWVWGTLWLLWGVNNIDSHLRTARKVGLSCLAVFAITIQGATVTFEWDPSPSAADEQLVEYRLYKADGTNWLKIATVPASTNRASVELPVGRHTITARSVNVWGESTNSNLVALPGPATAPFIRSVTVIIE